MSSDERSPFIFPLSFCYDMRKISNEQLISMGYSPDENSMPVKVENDIPGIVAGPYLNILRLLNQDKGPKGFDPLAVQLTDNTPIEVSKFISAMTSQPHMTRDTPDTVQTFNDIVPRSLDAGNFGYYFDNIVKNIPYKKVDNHE